ncbi:hypothetical protein [Clostridium sp.]|uniref:hypothetical protein n=1 Tax=Clostridium sp. TaxID=1506 RepID=UPI002FC85E4C
MRGINNLRLNARSKSIFNCKTYKNLSKTIILIYVLFMSVYVFRHMLYKLNNEYITLFAETAPNLIPSFLFTIIGMFYVVPVLFKDIALINESKFLWVMNALNIIIFLLIEYLHVIFNVGSWDNKDIIASLIGIAFSTIIYFKIRNLFTNLKMELRNGEY